MNSEKLALGLIGCGWISEVVHLPNLLANSGVEVLAVADTSDERRARAMRLVPGARAYRDAAALLADDRLQATLIATPPFVAAELAEAAFVAGKHVYLEKPGSISMAAAENIRSAWRGSGRVGMIGYNFRRNVAVEAALGHVRSGSLGALVGFQSVFTWAPGDDGGWRAQPGSGGALVDLASHHVDLARLVVGAEVVEASAAIRSIARKDDTADLALQFATGVVANIHVSSAEGRNANILRLFGRDGHLEVDLVRQGRVRVLRGDPPRGRLKRVARWLSSLDPASLAASGAEQSFPRLLDDFVRACRDGATSNVRPSIDDGVEVLRVLDMARATSGGAS